MGHDRGFAAGQQCFVKLARALAIVQAVVADALGPVSVVVADDHGERIAAATMGGAAPTRA